MHFKYAGIMNIVFVTLMYGFGMPILFPVAVAGLVISYISEKALLYYSYRQPPSYDQRLSNSVMRLMMGAPIFMLFFGYWMLSSKQLVSNKYLQGRAYGDDAFVSQHVMGDIFSSSGWVENPAWPVLLMAFLALLISSFHKLLNKLFDRLFPFWEIGDCDPNEEIGDYWKCLDGHDLGWSYWEEKQFRTLFDVYDKKFQMLDEHSWEQLSKEYERRKEIEAKNEEGSQNESIEPVSTIQGCHSYDVLANPNYFDDFCYIPVFQ